MSASLPAASFASTIVASVRAVDGAYSELICFSPDSRPQRVLYWLPAMGVPAKHYVPMAEAFAARGIAVALHEWRGIGSSNRRAGRHANWGYRELLEADLNAGMEEIKARWPQTILWLGGHSLGGQVSCLYAGLHPDVVSGIILVASGTPYWRLFPRGWMILTAYLLANGLTRLIGHLPGRKIGFGGNEARGVIADWARSGCTGCYSVAGMDTDFECAIGTLAVPVLALRMGDDWLAPSSSLEGLLNKLPNATRRIGVVTSDRLAGLPADHFSWMRAPGGVATQLIDWMLEMD